MNIDEIIAQSEEKFSNLFKEVDDIALYNQNKVLKAFQNNKVALRHFASTTGYGYDDTGRDTLCKIYAEVFGGESAIVSPNIASGTHAITLGLFGILRPNDTILSVSGMPYDTLSQVIFGDNIGSLKDYNINFQSVDLNGDDFDFNAITKAIEKYNPKAIFIQRSRGYSWRNALSINKIKELCEAAKKITNAAIIVDNCYGEFVDKQEPLDVGADIIMGSLIKNPGGGLVPTGGYIAGRKDLVDLISFRMTAPGVGAEIGSYAFGYQYYYQGFFMAPHVTAQAIKGSILFGAVFEELGYTTLPKTNSKCNDIIRSIKFDTKNELVAFCQSIQKCSPVDSHVIPYPWDMPGYEDQVIMAAGTFVQGASIELSADSPIKEPYIAYLQGALTYEHAKIAVKECVKSLLNA